MVSFVNKLRRWNSIFPMSIFNSHEPYKDQVTYSVKSRKASMMRSELFYH
jgi:hypothetical protein